MNTQNLSKCILPILVLFFFTIPVGMSSRELKPDEEKKLIKEHLIYELRKQDIKKINKYLGSPDREIRFRALAALPFGQGEKGTALKYLRKHLKSTEDQEEIKLTKRAIEVCQKELYLQKKMARLGEKIFQEINDFEYLNTWNRSTFMIPKSIFDKVEVEERLSSMMKKFGSKDTVLAFALFSVRDSYLQSRYTYKDDLYIHEQQIWDGRAWGTMFGVNPFHEILAGSDEIKNAYIRELKGMAENFDLPEDILLSAHFNMELIIGDDIEYTGFLNIHIIEKRNPMYIRRLCFYNLRDNSALGVEIIDILRSEENNPFERQIQSYLKRKQRSEK